MISALAERQHGVVGRAQLVAAGIGRRAIARRIESGTLHPLHRGVYAVGHRIVSERGRWMAATLATGGVLSHRSAGALWGLRPWNGRIEITIPWKKSKRAGLFLYRAVLAPDEITTHDGIPSPPPPAPSTTSPRTERHPTKKGTATIRTLAPPTHTRSDLEARFTTFLNDRRFPRPQTNVVIEGERGRRRLARP